MENEILIRNILVFQTALMFLMMFPGCPSEFWQTIMKRYMLRREQRMLKRNKRAEERLKRYWEIDVKKFK